MAEEKAKPAEEKKSGGAKKWIVRILMGLLLALFAISLLILTGYGHIHFMSIVEALICPLCIHEIMGISGNKNKAITRIMMGFSFLTPLYFGFRVDDFLDEKISGITGMLAGIFVLTILILMLKMYSKTRFEHVVMGLFASFAIPLSFSCIGFTFDYMDNCGVFTRAQVIFTILMAMYAAWLCDTFALFVGSAKGKHKMAPNISPKKSVEGAIGGVVGTTVIALLTYLVCWIWYFPHDAAIRWWMVLIFMPVLCVMGMCGDLAASVIKRNYGVKDFGTLIPEHGGAMDRVDSFLFTMPATYILVRLLTEIFA